MNRACPRIPSLLGPFAIAVSVVGCGDRAEGVDAEGVDGPLSCGGGFVEPPEPTGGGYPHQTESHYTDLDLADGSVRVCGSIGPFGPDPVGGGGDGDKYSFASTGMASSSIITRIALAIRPERLARLYLFAGAAGLVPSTRQVMLGDFVGRGTVRLESYVVENPGSTAYEIEVQLEDGAVCAPVPSTYIEAADGAGNSGNDALWLQSYSPDYVDQRLRPVTSPTSVPEPSGGSLTIEAGGSYRIDGTFGDNAQLATYDDDYADRDTYVISIGADVNELTVVAPDSVDFAVTEPVTGVPALLEFGRTVQMTAVEPGATYWLWVANQGAPSGSPYEVDLCGSFHPA